MAESRTIEPKKPAHMKSNTIRHINPAAPATAIALLILASMGSAHAQIPNGSVTTNKLARASVTTLKLADSSVTTRKIADRSITLSKLVSNIGVWLSNGSDVYWNGKVGIGTRSPATALDVDGTISAASLRAPGAGVNTGTFAFIHRVTAESIARVREQVSFIDNPLCNGDPNAILIITHNWSADKSVNPYHTNPVGVYYQNGKWSIFNQDLADMEVGDAFNVMVIKP